MASIYENTHYCTLCIEGLIGFLPSKARLSDAQEQAVRYALKRSVVTEGDYSWEQSGGGSHLACWNLLNGKQRLVGISITEVPGVRQ